MPKHYVNPTIRNNGKRAEARWRCPPTRRLKLNFDGASRGNLGKSGIGCIVRDSNGNLVWGMSKKIQEEQIMKQNSQLSKRGSDYA